MNEELKAKVGACRVLLVGAGGIGCEVLKCLTLSGFKQIEVVDLDTIDVSNLNRQFLFNRSHVGQSKAGIAAQIAQKYYSLGPDHGDEHDLSINALHKSITLSEFDIDYYRQFSFVINALDNRAARSHVNRMCLSADIPLIESGTAGYMGQVTFIKRSLTACYECEGLRRDGRTFATCTIRNTPSQPIHCIVWAKHLFHQLFGESDPDNDVSPQTEAPGSEHKNEINGNSKDSKEDDGTNETAAPISTRQWATNNNYDVKLLFKKLFENDIEYLLSMDNLWKEREKPSPLTYERLLEGQYDVPSKDVDQSKPMTNGVTLDNQKVWTLKKCCEIFQSSVSQLHARSKSEYLEWDKDDEQALDFVTAASNLRSQCFRIERQSKFEVKSLAGNIIPAISSTNSIIAGLIVLQALKLVKTLPSISEYRQMEPEERNRKLANVGKQMYLKKVDINVQKLISPYEAAPPQPNCLACSTKGVPEVAVHLSMQKTTFMEFVDKVIVGAFHFVCPDIGLDDNSGTILWSKDDDESDDQLDTLRSKKLCDFPQIKAPKTRLTVTDLIQDKNLIVILNDDDEMEEPEVKQVERF